MFDIEGKVDGFTRKAGVTYLGAFNEDNEEVEAAREKINESIGKLIDVCIERRRAAKENSGKEILLVRDLRKKIKELEEQKGSMDDDEWNAKFVEYTQKLLYGLDGGNDKQEIDDTGDEDENEDNMSEQ